MGLLIHARRMVSMFDGAINLLGPEIEELTEHLAKVGASHLNYGVRPSHLASMGRALLAALAHTLGERWTNEYEASWRLVYDEFSEEILRSMFVAQQAKVQKQQDKAEKRRSRSNSDDGSKRSSRSRESTRSLKSRESTRSGKSRDSTRSGRSRDKDERSKRRERKSTRSQVALPTDRSSEHTSKETEKRSEHKENNAPVG